MQQEMSKERGEVIFHFAGFTAHPWSPAHRQSVADIVRACLEPYGLQFEPEGADKDAIEVEEFYLKEGKGGEFWVVREEGSGKVVGSGGFYQVEVDGEGRRAAEIRKMYLLPEARGKKLGRFLLEVRVCGCLIGISPQTSGLVPRLLYLKLYKPSDVILSSRGSIIDAV